MTTVTITFHPNADMSSLDELEATCLPPWEIPTYCAANRSMTFTTTRSITQVIDGFEAEGFNFDEFVSFLWTN